MMVMMMMMMVVVQLLGPAPRQQLLPCLAARHAWLLGAHLFVVRWEDLLADPLRWQVLQHLAY